MLKTKKYIIDLKFKFFQILLDWFMTDLSLVQLESHFHFFIASLNIPISQVIDAMEIKAQARGGFKKNLVMDYILIHKRERQLIHKYLLSSGNIFQGECLFNKELFFKFTTGKAVRDKSSSKENFFICEVKVVDDKIFYSLLRNKLLEECKEILRTKNHIDLLEELGDFYAVIKELETRKPQIEDLSREGSSSDKYYL